MPSKQVEKVDALWDGQFSTIYTCSDCAEVRDRIKQEFADDDDCLRCHGEMYEYLWESEADLLWDEDAIEEEASGWVPDYDERLGVIRGKSCLIATKVDWLHWRKGRLCLIKEKTELELAN